MQRQLSVSVSTHVLVLYSVYLDLCIFALCLFRNSSHPRILFISNLLTYLMHEYLADTYIYTILDGK